MVLKKRHLLRCCWQRKIHQMRFYPPDIRKLGFPIWPKCPDLEKRLHVYPRKPVRSIQKNPKCSISSFGKGAISGGVKFGLLLTRIHVASLATYIRPYQSGRRKKAGNWADARAVQHSPAVHGSAAHVVSAGLAIGC